MEDECHRILRERAHLEVSKVDALYVYVSYEKLVAEENEYAYRL
jgi:hypothetical protein